MNLNRAILVGRVTKDPELKTTPSGQPVATFSLATNQTYTDKAGVKKESAEFHNIVFWGKQAEVAAKFLIKGSLCLVEGRIVTRSWDDTKTGEKKRTTEIVGEKLQLGPRPGIKPVEPVITATEERSENIEDDDLPF